MRIGGSGPSGALSASLSMAIASSGVLPWMSCVARLATAIAVSQPKVWKVALSITFFPPSSRNLIHIRSMSPQSALPAVPTASAFSISPRFFGSPMALSIFC